MNTIVFAVGWGSALSGEANALPYCSDQPHGRAAAARAVRVFRVVRRSYANTRLDMGKANLQLIANEENQDRAECGKNETGGMISFVCRTRKHVGYGAADD